jgi:hypothetical protein
MKNDNAIPYLALAILILAVLYLWAISGQPRMADGGISGDEMSWAEKLFSLAVPLSLFAAMFVAVRRAYYAGSWFWLLACLFILPVTFIYTLVVNRTNERFAGQLQSGARHTPVRIDHQQIAAACHRLTSLDHVEHEDLIALLQKAKNPYAIPALRQAVLMKPSLAHLDYDDYGSYYKKCFWALSAIGTDEALAVIQEFSNSPDPVLAEAAHYRLGKLLGAPE